MPLEFQRWQVGDVRITKVLELEVKGTVTWLLPDATKEALLSVPWLQPHFCDADGRSPMSVHALVIENEGRRILVDTCVGNDKPRPIPGWNLRQGGFLADLESAGFPAASIDTGICTTALDHRMETSWGRRMGRLPRPDTCPASARAWEAADEKHTATCWAIGAPPCSRRAGGISSAADVPISARSQPSRAGTHRASRVRLRSRGEEAGSRRPDAPPDLARSRVGQPREVDFGWRRARAAAYWALRGEAPW